MPLDLSFLWTKPADWDSLHVWSLVACMCIWCIAFDMVLVAIAIVFGVRCLEVVMDRIL